MIITDKRVNVKDWFKTLAIGEVFEYLERFYMKIGIAYQEANAVDLLSGEIDIIRSDAEVDVLDAELIVSQKGEEE